MITSLAVMQEEIKKWFGNHPDAWYSEHHWYIQNLLSDLGLTSPEFYEWYHAELKKHAEFINKNNFDYKIETSKKP